MKNIIAVLFGLIILMTFSSCEDELEKRYTNPDQTSEASIGKFFTKMLNNDRVRPSYWNVRTFLAMHQGKYTQSMSFTNGNKRYEQQLSYIDDFWRDFYTSTGSGIIAHLQEMRKAYEKMSDDEKAKVEVFMKAADVIVAEQTSQMVDMWGDIPFFSAGGLMLSGESAPPVFDDAQEIYNALLDQLEDAANYFANADLESTVKASFEKQDILLGGSVDKWERFANSLRLRLLIRTSFVDESSAETQVMEMLNNPNSYPLVENSSYDVLLSPLTDYNDNMRNALTEVSSHVATEFLLDDILKPSLDPRIRVWFDKNSVDGVANEDYFAMPLDISSSEQEDKISNGEYAILDSATFLFNSEFPGIVMTSAEVNFLKAEAYQRWGSTGNARTAYEQGVIDAVDFMFYLNELGDGEEETVSSEELDEMLASPIVAYTGTSDELLEKIWTQKWLSFGFMQSIQSWAEIRRTKVPELTFVEDTGTPDAKLPPSRLLYPSSERIYNATNYAKVAADDIATGKIFWDNK